MKLSEYLPKRMKEIMAERGMEASDFISSARNSGEENLRRITPSRFYKVLDGENDNPKLDFIQSFCDLAGIESLDFFAGVKKESKEALTNDEKEMLLIMRTLKRDDERALLRYARYIKDADDNK